MFTSIVTLFSAFLVPRYPTFDQWLGLHNRSYQFGSERDYRNSVYDVNVKRIREHNREHLQGLTTWRMAVNKFADLTSDEFSALYIGGFRNLSHPLNFANEHMLPNTSVLPSSVDWTTKGAVTAVKNQEQCGSCWAFSTTGSVEGAWFLTNGTLVSLSEQQLVDCSVPEGNEGCNGGLMDSAFQYIINNKGLTSETAYPYSATGPNQCQSGLQSVSRISSYKDVPVNSEAALLSAIAQQPVSVAVEADQDSFQFYSSGVMTKACGTQLDHGVLAVGYGTLGGQDYYLVKNSWGADWGLKGYIMLGRGPAFGAAGQCGIQMAASYPVV